MSDTDTVAKKKEDTRVLKEPSPWWVSEFKWLLTGFVFPSAVAAFLLWNYQTVGKEMVSTLHEVSESLRDLRKAFPMLPKKGD
jgi:hypothetical protein